MTTIDFLNRLTASARRYRTDFRDSLERNDHMHDATPAAIASLEPATVDAILVGFINAIGVEMACDYALYASDLATEESSR
jgi:hypothetical protein